MQKRLYIIALLLLLPVFLISCKKEGASGADPKVVAATLEQALKDADALDNQNMKAYEMGQVGASMAANGVAGADAVLDQALALAMEAQAADKKALPGSLKAASTDWSAADKEQVNPAIDRIEKATTRTWVIRSIAEGMAMVNAGKAKAVLAEAAASAEAIPDARYRDLDLRSIAGLMASLDAGAAVAVAGKISDPRVKAYALTEIGRQTGDGSVLAAAADAAVAIASMAPASELIGEQTPQEAKDSVEGAERARLAAHSAKALSAVAVAMARVSLADAEAMFAKAVQTAEAINDRPYTRAYAMSDVAMNLALVNSQSAVALAEKIDPGHADARFAAVMRAARMNFVRTGSMSVQDLEKAKEVAENMTDAYEKRKALTQVALAMVPVSTEGAEKLAEEIGGTLEHPGYKEMKNEVLAAVAVMTFASSGEEKAKEALGKIEEPRFANANEVYAKAKALCYMGDLQMASDAQAAKKLYSKAAGGAAEVKSQNLQWAAARRLCAIDGNALFDMASKIEGDEAIKASALADIAADMSARGDFRAASVWDLATRSANAVDDNAKSCEMLKEVAAKCAKSDKARAAAIYGMAVEKAGQIGVVEG